MEVSTVELEKVNIHDRASVSCALMATDSEKTLERPPTKKNTRETKISSKRKRKCIIKGEPKMPSKIN